jgi:tRNA A37 N6-isopentenylltransferase MiaA
MVYRGMESARQKAIARTPRARAPHHLIDLHWSRSKSYSAARFSGRR